MGLRRALSITSAAILATAGMAVGVAGATPNTVVVTPANTQGWSAVTQTGGATVNYIKDTSSPLPPGALQLTTDTNPVSHLQYLRNTNVPEPLSSTHNLTYATKQVAGPAVADPSYQLIICANGITGNTCSGYTTLVYEPYYNGTVVPGTWQNWNAGSGLWWSSRSITCSNGSITGTPGGPASYTLAQISTACPSAVVGSFGVNVGTYNLNYNVETDAVSFNNTVYDFELTHVPTNENQCKHDGYKNYTNANGEAFKNQGQCIRYVQQHRPGSHLNITNHNKVTVTNNNSQNATSGNASVSGGTSDGNAATGNASNSNQSNGKVTITNKY